MPVTIYNVASDWPRTFLQPGCFCFKIIAQLFLEHNLIVSYIVTPSIRKHSYI